MHIIKKLTGIVLVEADRQVLKQTYTCGGANTKRRMRVKALLIQVIIVENLTVAILVILLDS